MIWRSIACRSHAPVLRSMVQRVSFASRKLPKGRAKGSRYTVPSKIAKGFVTSRQEQAQNESNVLPPSASSEPSKSVSDVLRDTNSEINNLLAPVHIPEDPDGVLNERHPATKILANSAIVVQRQLEMMNIMLGFEQANRYVIMDPQGNHLGYMAEQEFGMGNMMARQWFRTHRSFTTHVFDKEMKEVLRVSQRLLCGRRGNANRASSTGHSRGFLHVYRYMTLWRSALHHFLHRLLYRILP